MERYQVLFLHKWFSLSGGVERVHKNLSIALAEQGVTSSFYVYKVSGDKYPGYKKLCEQFQAACPPAGSGFRARLRHLFEHIRQHNINVLISATETANMLALCCSLAFPELKVIYTRHCALDVSDQKLPPWLIKGLYNLYSLSNQSIVTVSRHLQGELSSIIKVGKSSVRFIPNAVVSDRVKQLANSNTDDFQSERYFCAVGRLVEQKGFDLLIRAYAIAKQRNPELPILVIVGIGIAREQLQQLAAQLDVGEQVIFTGFTDNPYYIINGAVAFILSSRHEGMPTALIEAMYLNTPVIAFDCPTGPAELIRNGENGFLVPYMDVDAMAQAIGNYASLLGKSITQDVEDFHYQNVAQAYMSQFL
ncbi:glycosyltransferase [Neptunicella marina]|uniref:Glycosyltransferase n=1 Tax=Neptunicella marina TaxID=2125989 RepID=A0A8J6M3M6_9ALTE|nr:glycosyltransferase [Neptunicella marina]MBC3767648.1 glycosyltransferase [Neptunicella marina]